MRRIESNKQINVKIFIFFVMWVSILFGSIVYAGEKLESKEPIPTTSKGIWEEIDKQEAELNKVIQTGKLTEVHHHVFAIRDLVNALVKHPGNLPADKLSQVKSSQTFVLTLAKRIDATADAKDQKGTEANHKKLQEILKILRANSFTVPEK